jgi:co-chaperonin GroES (HSP10)
LRSGIIIPDSAKEKPQEGEVIAAGHGKRLVEDCKLVPLEVKVGNLVLAHYHVVFGVLDAAPEAVKKAS